MLSLCPEAVESLPRPPMRLPPAAAYGETTRQALREPMIHSSMTPPEDLGFYHFCVAAPSRMCFRRWRFFAANARRGSPHRPFITSTSSAATAPSSSKLRKLKQSTPGGNRPTRRRRRNCAPNVLAAWAHLTTLAQASQRQQSLLPFWHGIRAARLRRSWTRLIRDRLRIQRANLRTLLHPNEDAMYALRTLGPPYWMESTRDLRLYLAVTQLQDAADVWIPAVPLGTPIDATSAIGPRLPPWQEDVIQGSRLTDSHYLPRKSALVTPRQSSVPYNKTYVDLVELIMKEDVQHVVHSGYVWRPTVDMERIMRHLTRTTDNLTGLIFANCLVLLPSDVAVQNLEYLAPTITPRTLCMITKSGTVVHDLRQCEDYVTNLREGAWHGVNLTSAAWTMWDVVVRHVTSPQSSLPLYDFLLLRTEPRTCECALYEDAGWRCQDRRCPRKRSSKRVTVQNDASRQAQGFSSWPRQEVQRHGG